MARHAAPLVTALRWFTRLPVRGRDDGRLDLALGWLPAVGLVVAAAGVAARAATLGLLGPAASAVCTVMAAVALTGAYHEDGLADSADGLWGGWTARRRLEIMRDSRLGTYGVTALVGSLVLRIALLVPLSLADTARALLVAEVVCRATALPLVAVVPPARGDGSVAALHGRPSPAQWGPAVAVTAVAAVVGAGPWAPAPIAVAGLCAAAVARTAHRRIGGITGDVLGAANQAAHLAALATMTALARAGLL